MTTVTGGANGCNATINTGNLTDILSSVPAQTTETRFVLTTASMVYTFTGTGFQYSGGVAVAGTITGVTQTTPGGQVVQTWAGCNVSWSSFWAEMTAAQYSGSLTAVNNLFFGGDDTFNMQASNGTDTLWGCDGNDTFNYAGNISGITRIDGGSGVNTLNLNGDISQSSATGFLSYVTNIQTVNFAAGHNYAISVGATTVATFDASALGADNSLNLGFTGSAAATVKGGAGNDTVVVAGPGSFTFNGGAGNDVVDYYNARGAVTVDLSKTTAQTVGSGMGSETLTSVEGVVVSYYGGTYTGSASDNVFQVVKSIGTTTIDGGDGNDMVWFNIYQPITGDDGGITVDLSGAKPVISGACGNVTTSNIESYKGTCRSDTFIGNAADNLFDGGSGGYDKADYSSAASGMTFTVSTSDHSRVIATGGGQGTDTLTNIYRVVGTSFDDTYYFQSGVRAFDGGAGTDTLVLAGNSTDYTLRDFNSYFRYEGGPGNDWNSGIEIRGVEKVQFKDKTIILPLQGSSDNDTIAGTSGNDTIDIHQGGDDVVQALGGDDTIITNGTLSSGDRIDGGDGNDTVSDSNLYSTLVTLGPNALANIETLSLTGYSVNLAFSDHTLTPGTTLTLNWNGGFLTFDASAETGAGIAFTDVSHGYMPTSFTGGGGNDTIICGTGYDKLKGGGGNDLINAGGGEDTIDGGSGLDTSIYLSKKSDYILTRNTDGSFKLVLAVSGGTLNDTLTHVERLQFSDQTVAIGTVAANDFTGSGKSAILWQNENGQAAIWTMDGFNQTAGSTVGGNPGPTWHVVGSGDFFGDGKADILWQNDDGSTVVWTMDGLKQTGNAWVGANPGPTWHVKGVADFNGDGKSDILWQNDNGQAAVWQMDGYAVTAGSYVGGNPGTDWHIVGTGDFNGDSKADIIWQSNAGQAVVWTMDGFNQTSSTFIGGNPGPTWHVKGAGDFYGDGTSDILWQNDAGQAVIWTMDGLNQTRSDFVGGSPGTDWHIIGAGDYNGDGSADILWQNDNGQAAVWTMNGISQLGGSLVGGNPGSNWHIPAGVG